MAGYKGIGIVFARRTARKAGLEATVAARLSSPARETFERATTTTWVPMEHAIELFQVAGPLLYVNAADPLRAIGSAMAHDNLGGPFKYFVRILSVPLLMRQTAAMWKTYHHAGYARSRVIGDKFTELSVHGYPDLPERFRECMCGWITGAIEMTGGKDARVVQVEAAHAHVWHMTWEAKTRKPDPGG